MIRTRGLPCNIQPATGKMEDWISVAKSDEFAACQKAGCGTKGTRIVVSNLDGDSILRQYRAVAW